MTYQYVVNVLVSKIILIFISLFLYFCPTCPNFGVVMSYVSHVLMSCDIVFEFINLGFQLTISFYCEFLGSQAKGKLKKLYLYDFLIQIITTRAFIVGNIGWFDPILVRSNCDLELVWAFSSNYFYVFLVLDYIIN